MWAYSGLFWAKWAILHIFCDSEIILGYSGLSEPRHPAILSKKRFKNIQQKSPAKKLSKKAQQKVQQKLKEEIKIKYRLLQTVRIWSFI